MYAKATQNLGRIKSGTILFMENKKKEIDFEKLNLIVWTAEKDSDAINEIVMSVVPLLKGYTINQIETALFSCLRSIKSGAPINY